MRAVRWKATVPLALLLGLVALVWVLYADVAVRRGIEYVGAEIVGARVDVASAHLSLTGGSVVVRGLQVANPDAPMKNLVQADAAVAQIRVLPLLEKKIVIDTLAIRGVRFGTARRTSGALPRRSPTTGRVARAISDWAGRIQVPPLNLQGLTSVVDVSRLRLDSLRTVAEARAVMQRSDSLQATYRAQLATLDPQPQVDSARALADRLKQADVRALGLTGTRDLLTNARANAARLGQSTDRVKSFEERVKSGVGSLRSGLDGLSAARQADYAYARGMVNLPSLDAPDLSPALFGEMAVQRLQPILYWLNLAEQYVPPGLDPRRVTGPDRVRAPGITVRFPRPTSYPAFLVEFAGADAELGGTGAAAGRYAARLTGLTTAPTLYGKPARFLAERSGAARGPRTGAVTAVLSHMRVPISDSVSADLDGIALPTVLLPAAGARLALGNGSTRIRLVRTGDNLDGSITWRSTALQWTQPGADSAGPPVAAGAAVGSAAWTRDLLWRTVSRLNSAEIEVRVSGRASGPAIGVRSNIGQAVAAALTREIGDEVSRQEQRLRAEVDKRVAAQVQEAQARVNQVQTQVESVVSQKRAELEQAKAELETQIRQLTTRLPVRIP